LINKLLFFFGALGVFNTVLASAFLLLSAKKKSNQTWVLSFLLLCFTIRVGVSCFYYFGPVPPQLIKLGLSANLLIGPALVHFILISQAGIQTKLKSFLLHVLSWILLLFVLGLTFSFEVWDTQIRMMAHAVLTIYLFYSTYILFPTLRDLSKKRALEPNLYTALLIWLTVLAVSGGFVLSLYTTYILGPLVYSIVFYISASVYYQLSKKPTTKYGNKKLDPARAGEIEQKLRLLMTNDKLYRNAGLKLEELAESLKVSRHFLSQLTNDNMNTSFTQLVNEYRVEEACKLLMEKEHYSLESIGYEVGFNSKSSFFASFKKLKGATPTEYRKSIDSSIIN